MIQTLIILAVAAALFVYGKPRADLVAISVLMALMVTGVLTPGEGLAGFSSSIVMLLIGVFVVGGAVSRTGLAKRVSRKILALAGASQIRLFILIMLVTSGIGAFVSNTGTVAIMMPIVVVLAVMLAALALIFTGCFRTVEEAYKTISWQSVVLIGAMLPVAAALEKTGAVGLASSALNSMVGGAGPYALLAAVYAMASFTTLFVSNTAAGALCTPIALQAALGMGYSPYPFLFGVATAASMSLAFPFSTPPNVLVMAPGLFRPMTNPGDGVCREPRTGGRAALLLRRYAAACRQSRKSRLCQQAQEAGNYGSRPLAWLPDRRQQPEASGQENTPCSIRIFTPMPIRTSPPSALALFPMEDRPGRRQTRLPTTIPTRVSVKHTRPITVAGHQMPTPSRAKESPTARASRLVAMPSTQSAEPRVGSEQAPESSGWPRFSHDSLSIRPPTKTSSAKAIQWS